MRFFESPNGHNEPTIWIDWHENPAATRTIIEPILSRCHLPARMRKQVWPHIVRTLTAGPTLESARVVIDTLNDEIRALREANSELESANTDLNGELQDLRRALT